MMMMVLVVSSIKNDAQDSLLINPTNPPCFQLCHTCNACLTKLPSLHYLLEFHFGSISLKPV